MWGRFRIRGESGSHHGDYDTDFPAAESAGAGGQAGEEIQDSENMRKRGHGAASFRIPASLDTFRSRNSGWICLADDSHRLEAEPYLFGRTHAFFRMKSSFAFSLAHRHTLCEKFRFAPKTTTRSAPPRAEVSQRSPTGPSRLPSRPALGAICAFRGFPASGRSRAAYKMWRATVKTAPPLKIF